MDEETLWRVWTCRANRKERGLYFRQLGTEREKLPRSADVKEEVSVLISSRICRQIGEKRFPLCTNGVEKCALFYKQIVEDSVKHGSNAHSLNAQLYWVTVYGQVGRGTVFESFTGRTVTQTAFQFWMST